MKAIRTIKLKVDGSRKADPMVVNWLKAANWLSNIVFKTKEMNSNRLSNAYYERLRRFGLTSQLACSLCKTVTATYKTAKENKRWVLATYRKPVMPVVWRRDFARSKRGVTLWNEVLDIVDSRPLPCVGWKDSKLKRVGSQWYLILAYEVEVPEPKPFGCVVGVDSGVKRMFTATNSRDSRTFFYRGGVLNHRRCCIRRTRASVQSVGTRSARRLLRRLSGNEAAVTGHLLHVASKALVGYAVAVGARRIVMEDLENIRDSSLSKGKDLRSKLHRWPYADGTFKVRYKAEAVGIEFELVSPKNTSRGCCKCGYVSASNRKGLAFSCQKCGHREDADRHASRNIRARSVAIEHNSVGTGSLKAPESYGTVDRDAGGHVVHDSLVSLEVLAKSSYPRVEEL